MPLDFSATFDNLPALFLTSTTSTFAWTLLLFEVDVPNDAAPVFSATEVCTINNLSIISQSHNDFDGRLATWFTNFPIPVSVTKLRLSLNGCFSESTAAILLSLAHCLVELELMVARKEDHDDSELPSTPVLFPNLRSLIYDIHLKSSIKLDHTGLLVNLEAPNLEEINVRFDTLASPKLAKCINFPGVDAYLSRPGTFPSLLKFEVALSVSIFLEKEAYGQRQIDTILSAVKPQFPNMVARGLWYTSTKIRDLIPRQTN
ncbi:hypothetical protein FB451DRAFT_1488301 [Mycena latifolia]|nr:hypothetical protein FB451DRAFT_1488301 [Mycena latifolia]